MINKNLYKISGALEQAGLGEFAYYLNKAYVNMGYAIFALDATAFDDIEQRSASIKEKIERIKDLVAEVSSEIESLPLEAKRQAEEATEERENKEQKEKEKKDKEAKQNGF